MDAHAIISLSLFAGFFFLLTSLLQTFTSRIAFPYTVALIIVGFLAQFLVHISHVDAHMVLMPEVIYFILLPILLFEAAMHINIHQFRLQFKTISFLATAGLMLSVFVIGFGLFYAIGFPLGPALLFGAIISSTDPIAVLSLFKTLGAPKRLSLLADGESMFNDATGVIAFRIISGFVVAGTSIEAGKIVAGIGDFVYVFIGSIVLGSLLGYVTSSIIPRLARDRLVINTLTAALGIGSFVGAEHFFHLSGVITTVMAGIAFGHTARTKISPTIHHFIHEFWEYLGFIAVSLVFFFASFNLDLGVFASNGGHIAIAVALVLIGRAVSVYGSAFITNRVPFFNDEPNIPVSWQHVLNWGGLRGVIPLVLVYSLPDSFIYKEEILGFTLATLLFTLIINGLTVKTLLLALKLHLPKKEEQIIMEEENIFELEEKREKLAGFPIHEFSKDVILSLDDELKTQEKNHKDRLLQLSTTDDFLVSLKLQALSIERYTAHELFEKNYIRERVLSDLDIELDLQQDALEYPELFSGRGYEWGGRLPTKETYRKRLATARTYIARVPFLSSFFASTEEEIVRERYSLLRARILTNETVLRYLRRVGRLVRKPSLHKSIDLVRTMYQRYNEKNALQVRELEEKYPEIVFTHQKRLAQSLLNNH